MFKALYTTGEITLQKEKEEFAVCPIKYQLTFSRLVYKSAHLTIPSSAITFLTLSLLMVFYFCFIVNFTNCLNYFCVHVKLNIFSC